jgi:hypothetical protein
MATNNTLVKTVQTSLLSWFVIMCVDFIFLASFAFTSSLNFSFFPDAASSMKIVVLYFCAGILTGLFAYGALVIKTSFYEPQPSDAFCLSLSLVLCINSLITIYSISRILNGGLPASAICLFLFPFLIWTFIKITASLQKGEPVALLASCISLETFWSVLRGSLRGGIFLTDLTKPSGAY